MNGNSETPTESPAKDPSEAWQLHGRHALVTGSTRGIGRAIADALLAKGASVTLSARSADDVDRAVDAYRRNGLPVDGVAADIGDPRGRQALFEHCLSTGLHLLVNNAGFNVRKDAVDFEPTEVQRLLDVNGLAVFELSRQLHPLLAASAGADGLARVVSVTSVSGLTSTRTGAPYAMAKAAVQQMTRNLAVEWAADGIMVNAVAPWYIGTPLVEEVLQRPGYLDRVLDRTPMGRIGRVDEVASAVVFFCLPAASYVTGQCLAVDGGFMAHGFQP